MDFLERLDSLMESRGLNKRQLSIQTKIPVSTIYGWYKKGYENITLPNLKALADYFGVTMEYLANGEGESSNTLRSEEMEKELRRLGAITAENTINHNRINTLITIIEASERLGGQPGEDG